MKLQRSRDSLSTPQTYTENMGSYYYVATNNVKRTKIILGHKKSGVFSPMQHSCNLTSRDAFSCVSKVACWGCTLVCDEGWCLKLSKFEDWFGDLAKFEVWFGDLALSLFFLIWILRVSWIMPAVRVSTAVIPSCKKSQYRNQFQ